MNLQYMREYIELVETLNFTAAANKLFITQPTLSRHISNIEEEIGTQLLFRTKHKVEVTEFGKYVYENFKNIIKIYDEVISTSTAHLSGFEGELKLGMLYYCIDEYVTPLIKSFKRTYPNINIELLSLQPDGVKECLQKDEVDVGVVMDVDYDAAFHEIYNIQKLRREKLSVLMSLDHPFAKEKQINILKLKGEKFIFFKLYRELNEYISKLLTANGVTHDDYLVTDQVDTIAYTIVETKGVSIVPSHLKNMRRDDVILIEIENEDFYIDMGIAYKSKNENPSLPLLLKETIRVFPLKL
ncbi:MAG: LysR family transcriptional regulator [Tissierellia bacterium]|nr:LysR family transcriptional regulator [Tissierellia bacterium]